MSAGDWKEMYGAAQSGDLELVKYHIENGVNPNYQHPEILSTPLVAAITAGHDQVAFYLIDNGADLELVSDFDNMTPMQAARHFRRQEVVSYLESKTPHRPKGSWLGKLLSKYKG